MVDMDWYQTTHNKEYTTILYFDYICIDRLSIFNWWWVNTCDTDHPILISRKYLGRRMLCSKLDGFVNVIMYPIIMKNYHNGFGFEFLDPAYRISGETL